MEALKQFTQFTSRLKPGKPARAGALTLVPLLDPDATADADLLEEALRKGTEVTEISDGGSVESVRVVHKGDKLLLLLDGEEIVGAKQNRIFNASFLVAPGQTVDLPVSCVEQGRWRYASKSFASAGRTLTGSARASKLKRVTGTMVMGGGYDANQGAVWNDVKGYLDKTRVHSGTMAFSDGAEKRAHEIARDLATFVPEFNQVGIAALDGERLISIDLFGSPGLLRRAYPKVTRGLVLDVPDATEAASDEAATQITLRALRLAGEAPATTTPAPGAGHTMIVQTPAFVASGISHEGTMYHCLIAPA